MTIVNHAQQLPYYQQEEIRRLRENSWLYGLTKALIGVL